jgi:hypothetical protein
MTQDPRLLSPIQRLNLAHDDAIERMERVLEKLDQVLGPEQAGDDA